MKDNWIGKQLGPYEVLERTGEKDSSGHTKYRIRCKYCGFEKETSPRLLRGILDKCPHLTTYKTPSFLSSSYPSKDRKLHGIFRGILARCYNPKRKDYRFYGGKGIKVCQEWLDNPESFVSWAKMNGYQIGLTIDRVDANKDYCPENCRWIPFRENIVRSSAARPITVESITHTGREWARVLHLGANAINRYRRKNGLEATENYIKSKLDAIEAQPR